MLSGISLQGTHRLVEEPSVPSSAGGAPSSRAGCTWGQPGLRVGRFSDCRVPCCWFTGVCGEEGTRGHLLFWAGVLSLLTLPWPGDFSQLPVCLCACVYECCLCVCVSPCACMCVCVSLCVSVYMSVCVSLCACVSICVYKYVCLSVCACVSLCVSVCMNMCHCVPV